MNIFDYLEGNVSDISVESLRDIQKAIERKIDILKNEISVYEEIINRDFTIVRRDGDYLVARNYDVLEEVSSCEKRISEAINLIDNLYVRNILRPYRTLSEVKKILEGC